MERGPRVRAKLAHGDIEICAAHCLSNEDKRRLAARLKKLGSEDEEAARSKGLDSHEGCVDVEACGKEGCWRAADGRQACGMENAKEIGAVLLALLVNLCSKPLPASDPLLSHSSPIAAPPAPISNGAAAVRADAHALRPKECGGEGGGRDSVVAQCCRYVEEYEAVFHPLMLLHRELAHFKASLATLIQVSCILSFCHAGLDTLPSFGPASSSGFFSC